MKCRLGEGEVKCSSCGVENVAEAEHCLRCGARLEADSGPSQQTTRPSESVAPLSQGTISKMIETPGTALLTLGVLFLLIAVIVGTLGHWIAAIALFAISVMLIYFAVQLRSHESKVAVAKATKTEVREREIVKVKCRYCGALNPDGATHCTSCGAVL